MWRRDFIKFPASCLPGWPVGEAGQGGAHHMGEGGQCRALTVLMEMWLRAGGKGPFWVWWLMDGKGGGDQNATAKTWTRPPKQGGRGRKGTGGHFLAEHCPPGWMRICRTSYTPIKHHLSLRATHLTNDDAKTHRGLQTGQDGAGVQPSHLACKALSTSHCAGRPPWPCSLKELSLPPSKLPLSRK